MVQAVWVDVDHLGGGWFVPSGGPRDVGVEDARKSRGVCFSPGRRSAAAAELGNLVCYGLQHCFGTFFFLNSKLNMLMLSCCICSK